MLWALHQQRLDPVGWTILNAMLLFNITMQTGLCEMVRRSRTTSHSPSQKIAFEYYRLVGIGQAGTYREEMRLV